MSRRLERWRGRLVADRPEVVVCRGGHCGSRREHPGFDHGAQLERFRDELRGAPVTVSVSKCLDECDHANVVVVTPGGPAAGAPPVWVGSVLDDATTDAVIEWVRGTGGFGEPPEAVGAHRFVPTHGGRIRRTGAVRSR
ncbi:hypothetical protein [Amnibacterium kyonggiense]